MTSDACHVTLDRSHVICDTQGIMNIVLKCQVPSSIGLGNMIFWRLGVKGYVYTMNQQTKYTCTCWLFNTIFSKGYKAFLCFFLNVFYVLCWSISLNLAKTVKKIKSEIVRIASKIHCLFIEVKGPYADRIF